MASKQFHLQLVFRISFITIFSIATAYLWFAFGRLYFIIPMIVLVVQVFGLIKYLNRTNKRMAFFFESINNEDFSVRFDEENAPESVRELHRKINEFNQRIRETFMRNEEQEKYHQKILDQLNTGIVIFNQKGHIRVVNPAAGRLLNCHPLHHIRQLERAAPGLYDLFSKGASDRRNLFKFSNERETIQLVMEFSRISLRDDVLTLVTIQDINSELEYKETDSWIKLIRVLTHEIMNTITPIASLSDTLVHYFKKESNGDLVMDAISKEQILNTVRGLEVIRSQGNDLMSFVQSYRNFLNIPEPDKKITNIAKLFNKVAVLVEQEKGIGVTLNIQKPQQDAEIFADEKQITQILVNLSKNALQAMQETKEGVLQITFRIEDTGKKYIDVIDNGPGMSQEVRDQIFVPFFTTKQKGTGIGLSLSRKIMQMHGGNLNLIRSIPYSETVFRLEF
ncbi:sensor histidine kinase [Membranihabitans maritimus]|uniref:sensor histidine kinase n=1 Tax=Membranihabitans maritimus TaxID=2904244 RepID=UPI001F3EF740|nr:ATP-binding protein [Membranihabitans maritimus]